jgi:hypothetical protein
MTKCKIAKHLLNASVYCYCSGHAQKSPAKELVRHKVCKIYADNLEESIDKCREILSLFEPGGSSASWLLESTSLIIQNVTKQFDVLADVALQDHKLFSANYLLLVEILMKVCNSL